MNLSNAMERATWRQFRRHYRDLLYVDKMQFPPPRTFASGRYLMTMPVWLANLLQRTHVPPTPRQIRLQALVNAQRQRRAKRAAIRINQAQLCCIGAF